MNKEKKRLLLVCILICIECCAIVYIWKVYFNKTNTLQHNVLSRELLTFVPDSKLKYYYTLSHDSTYEESASWLKEKVTYHFNRDGLADVVDYDINKSEGTFRIMTLGDSFVFGMWVNPYQNFSKQLEQLLNTKVTCPSIQKFEVINLGAPGFDALYTAKRYADIGAKYTPDFLIWFLRGENIFMNMDRYHEEEEVYKKNMNKDIAKTHNVDVQDPYAASTIVYEEYMEAFEKLSKNQQETFIHPEIEAIQSVIKQSTSQLLFLIPQEEDEIYKNRIKAFAVPGSSVSYQEIEGIETFFPNDYHPNVQGHAHIAKVIFDYLLSTTLRSCHK